MNYLKDSSTEGRGEGLDHIDIYFFMLIIDSVKLIPRSPHPGGEGGGLVLGSIFAGYVPSASQNPYLIVDYSVAKLWTLL